MKRKTGNRPITLWIHQSSTDALKRLALTVGMERGRSIIYTDLIRLAIERYIADAMKKPTISRGA